MLKFNAFWILTAFKGKLMGKIEICAHPRALNERIEYFGGQQTQFNGVLTQISLVMHKNDK